MNCVVCKKQFNLVDRVPLFLPCCGETICKECYQNLSKDTQQETFKCPISYCGEQCSLQTNFKVNKIVETWLKESLAIYCDEHPNELAEFYCKDHHSLVCMECVINNHKTDNTNKVIKQALNEYHTTVFDKLTKEYKRIGKLLSIIEAYSKNQLSFTASNYLKKINKIQEILLPRLKTQQEKDNIKFLNQNLVVAQQIQQIQQMSQTLIPNIDSVIIKPEDHQFIKECFNQQEVKLELLYRGSRDTFTGKAFYDKCNNKGPTICVIKSEHNRVFGGYTSVSWKGQDKQQPDQNAFIFSLTFKKKFDQH